MGLPTRNLDDRTFQDIVDEAKKRITASCPDWTDHNVSDPGITLIELFAWMTEMILYRLNQVPERHLVKLLELMGLELKAPEPARTRLTFYLAGPQPAEVTIPAGAEVASAATKENTPAVIFTTDENRVIRPLAATPDAKPGIMYSGTGDNGRGWPPDASLVDLKTGGSGSQKKLAVFGPHPESGGAWYLGFDVNLSWHVLDLDVNLEKGSAQGLDPDKPPWQWEGWGYDTDPDKTRPSWHPAEIDQDTTRGLTQSGTVTLRLPPLVRHMLKGDKAWYWVRCRVEPPKEGATSTYTVSPAVYGVTARSMGATVGATHAQAIRGEVLGVSDGSAGQVFQLQFSPVLARRPDEAVQVQSWAEGAGGDGWEDWTEVEDWTNTRADDPHYSCDSRAGEIRFGPAIRLASGEVRRFGRIPPRGASIRVKAYRVGGATAGNVPRGDLTALRQSISGVDRVNNHVEARGGHDAETVEAAKLRAPNLYRTRDRAVTLSDFEALALEADSRVGRVKCFQSEGGVTVVLVPRVHRPERYLEPDLLMPDADLTGVVERYLDARRLLTVRLKVMAAEYVWVQANLRVRARQGAAPMEVRKAVQDRIFAYLNPIVGGPDRSGWPFGRPFRPAELYGWLQAKPDLGIVDVSQLSFKQFTRKSASEVVEEDLKVEGSIDLVAHALIASERHVVTVE